MINFKITKVGDWKNKLKKFSAPVWEATFTKHLSRAIGISAMLLERAIKINIAQGRSEWKPLNPLTLQMRGEEGLFRRAILVATGDMKKAVTHQVQGLLGFAGLLRTSRNSDGTSCANIGFIQEYGATITVTPKVRGYFLANKVFLKKDTKFLRIPGRPFVQPAANENEIEVRQILDKGLRNALDEISFA